MPQLQKVGSCLLDGLLDASHQATGEMRRAASIEGTGTKLAYVQGRWPEVIITTGLLELEKPSGAKLLIVACQELILWRVWSDSDSFYYIFLNFLKFIQDIAHSAQVMEIGVAMTSFRLSIPPGLESPRVPEVRWSLSKNSEKFRIGPWWVGDTCCTQSDCQDLSRSFNHL